MTFYSPFVAEQGRPILNTPLGSWWLGPWPPPHETVPPIDPSIAGLVLQPKWATGSIWERTDVESYANSKLNLIDMTVGATEGVAPLWTAATGWQGTGTQYLTTGYVTGARGQNTSMFGACNSPTGANFYIGGAWTAMPLAAVYLAPINGVTGMGMRNCSVNYTNTSPPAYTLGFAGTKAYFNGVYHGVIGAFLNNENLPHYVLAINYGGVTVGKSDGYVVACAWYTDVITNDQALAVLSALDIIRMA